MRLQANVLLQPLECDCGGTLGEPLKRLLPAPFPVSLPFLLLVGAIHLW